jgi:glutamate synthase domain-containing protein 3
VGYYAAGMSDGVRLTVHGSAGWGLAECLMSGTVVVDGNAGNGAAASIRGGTVVVKGDAAARAGVSMKGGLLVIGGGCGYMTGFMMQRGQIIVCGDAGDAVADSMYEGVIYVGGDIAALGSDAVVSEASAAELAEIHATSRATGSRDLARSGRSCRGASSGTTTRRTWRHGRQRSEDPSGRARSTVPR